MFTDESIDAVGVEPQWRKSLELAQESRGCQTRAVHTTEAEVQSFSTTTSSTQMDQNHISEEILIDNDRPVSPGLREFLQQVEDSMIKELAKNAKSHAFDGFQVNWEDHNKTVSFLHSLQHPSAQERGLQVTSISWNCTGSVIACGFGRIEDGDWSKEESCVCTWNLDRRGLNPKQPDVHIDVANAVMALSFHPSLPSLIAGGLYSGEVVVWDTSRTEDPVMAQTGMSADTHREPVCQVNWVSVSHQRRGELGVLSAGSGGRVLLWTMQSDHGRLVLCAGYALIRQQVPYSSSAFSKAQANSSVGITSLAMSTQDPDTFLVGSEGGLVLKCSFSAQTPAAVPLDGESVTLKAPVVFSFSQRGGPVHSLHCSPFHRNLFLSVGTDGLAHLHSLLQSDPLLSLRVSDSYVFAVRWSPTRPLVFAATTGQGVVQMFDLGQQSLRPAATIDQNTAGQPAFCLEFNPHQTHLLAVGNADGTVNICHLSADLKDQAPQEIAHLERLANDVTEYT
ncbi:cytoplasmic dynein 2 intermediate chain 2 [Aplochiton taeniatus]